MMKENNIPKEVTVEEVLKQNCPDWPLYTMQQSIKAMQAYAQPLRDEIDRLKVKLDDRFKQDTYQHNTPDCKWDAGAKHSKSSKQHQDNGKSEDDSFIYPLDKGTLQLICIDYFEWRTTNRRMFCGNDFEFLSRCLISKPQQHQDWPGEEEVIKFINSQTNNYGEGFEMKKMFNWLKDWKGKGEGKG